VYYHTNAPPFDETIKLTIPEEAGKFERCHLLFTFYHCSGSKPRQAFGFSFLELANPENGAALKDMEYSLSSYKLLDGMDKGKMVIPKYLQNKGKLSVRNYRSGLSKIDEIFTVRTTMCSTKKTQNGVLHDLINWRTLEDAKLEEVLKNAHQLSDDEVFKFLKEIMDALCAIFSEKVSILRDHGRAVHYLLVSCSRPGRIPCPSAALQCFC